MQRTLGACCENKSEQMGVSERRAFGEASRMDRGQGITYCSFSSHERMRRCTASDARPPDEMGWFSGRGGPPVKKNKINGGQ